MKPAGFRPVGREDVEGWRLLACLESLLQWDGQRRAVKQLLVLNGGTPESLPHGNVLKRHYGREGRMESKRKERGRDGVRFFKKYVIHVVFNQQTHTSQMKTMRTIWLQLVIIIIAVLIG